MPPIGPCIKETLWKDTALKIKINNGGVRRIPVDRILQNENGRSSNAPSPSIAKLLNYVKQYNDVVPRTKEFVPIIHMSYIDEDEEKIEVSTDLELLEAITSLHKSSKLGCAADSDSWVLQNEPSQSEISKKHEEVQNLKVEGSQYILRLNASIHLQRKHVALRNQLESLPPAFHKANQIPIRTDPSTKLPAGIVVIDALFSLVANVLDNFQYSQQQQYAYQQQQKQQQQQKLQQKERQKQQQLQMRQTNLKPERNYSNVPPPKSTVKDGDYSSFDKSFVHKRHSCDNCDISPIVGYRYHSIQMANYDLCHQCFCIKYQEKDSKEDLTSYRLVQYKTDRFFKRTKKQRKMTVKDVCGILGKRRRQLKGKTGKSQAPVITKKMIEATNVIVNDEIIQKSLKDIHLNKATEQNNLDSKSLENDGNIVIDTVLVTDSEKIRNNSEDLTMDTVVVIKDEKDIDQPLQTGEIQCQGQKHKSESKGCEGLDDLIHLAERELKQINNLSFTSLSSIDNSQGEWNEEEIVNANDSLVVENYEVLVDNLDQSDSDDSIIELTKNEDTYESIESTSVYQNTTEATDFKSIDIIFIPTLQDELDCASRNKCNVDDDAFRADLSFVSDSSILEIEYTKSRVRDKYSSTKEYDNDSIEDDWEIMDESDDDFAIVS